MILYRVQIPFKQSFKHASNQRSISDNIVVETLLEDGTVGYGEGLPRTYVTGETQESVIRTLTELNSSFFSQDVSSPKALVDFIDKEILSQKNFKLARQNNTARCALELSLLDAYSRSLKISFHDIAKLAVKNPASLVSREKVQYCGVLSLESLKKAILSSLKMRIFGFAQLKVKLGADQDTNISCLKWIRRIVGKNIELHVDANEAWDLATAKKIIPMLVPFDIGAVEQPMPHSKVKEMTELKRHSQIPLMLDESFCDLQDAEQSVINKSCDMWNIRISKCGGFISSLRMAELARENQMGYQLGAMVGESGILSAAGRQFATLDPSYTYLEGSFDRYLLTENLTNEDITFGRQGWANAIHDFGLGVSINKSQLEKFSINRHVLFST